MKKIRRGRCKEREKKVASLRQLYIHVSFSFLYIERDTHTKSMKQCSMSCVYTYRKERKKRKTKMCTRRTIHIPSFFHRERKRQKERKMVSACVCDTTIEDQCSFYEFSLRFTGKNEHPVIFLVSNSYTYTHTKTYHNRHTVTVYMNHVHLCSMSVEGLLRRHTYTLSSPFSQEKRIARKETRHTHTHTSERKST